MVVRPWQIMLFLSPPYYAFEHCPKFSLLCLLKEPIMPHIDVIYNSIIMCVFTKKSICCCHY